MLSLLYLRNLLGGLLWAAGVVSGFLFLGSYEHDAGRASSAPASWPASSEVERAEGRPSLLVFAHPRCPCTRATIEELNRLLASVGDEVRAVVLLVTPPGVAPGWERGALEEAARRIPGVVVEIDEEAREARRFGVHTSGSTLLYGPDGALRFCGGITRSRGHAGDNAGRSAIEALVLTGGSGLHEAPVFGCELVDAAPVEERESE